MKTPPRTITRTPTASLGALAAGLGLSGLAWAQAASKPAEPAELPVVRTQAAAEQDSPDSKKYLATESRIGKGKQELRDIPQSVTVVTEKLMEDRKLDTLKDTLRQTAGISFQAAEGGEEDIRLRGFALQTTGDVFADGLRDPAFYDRDTFFLERIEVLRGSASMLFGRGSTGGAVNLVNKAPRLKSAGKVDLSLASHDNVRGVLDWNQKLGTTSALRLGAMLQRADNNGAGTRLSKQGVAASFATGIGQVDEWQVGIYHLDNENGINYGLPWLRTAAGNTPDPTTDVMRLDPTAYFGMASDRNHGRADQLTLSHTHRFDGGGEWITKLRLADYDRDQRASTVRFGAAATQPDKSAVIASTLKPTTVLTRGFQPKVQQMQTLHAQSDYSGRHQWLGLTHEIQTGADIAVERKQVDAAYSAAQGGLVPTKATTLLGTPNDGASVDEGLRSFRRASDYNSKAAGVYVQDLAQLRPDFKLLGGLRFDHLAGEYFSNAIPNNAQTPVTRTSYRMTVNQWSWRAGALWQPSPLQSFHASAATSFNTSGDAYSLNAANQNIPPEKAMNLELGAKLDSEDGDFSTRFAIFRTTKLHERNTDPLTPDIVTLSGKRHAAGVEMDFSGQVGDGWQVFASWMWLPIAKIDVSSANSGELQGDRPSLTPRVTGTLWVTREVGTEWRFGAGVNARGRQAPNRNPGWEARGFVTADVMAEYRPDENGPTYKLNISNLTNKLYADALYSGHYVPGAGRIVTLTGTYAF
ncbi:TonB-dependent receptor [Roseateles sp.]|uniref:TonB-dependent receptor n=1 Tax=Roseateles sp. TaxID=1971397 RepID=UPI0039514844